MKVLYLNHTGQMSGAERSLLDLLAGLPAEVEPTLACSPDGPLSAAAEAAGIPVAAIAGAGGSLTPHPRRTPRAVRDLGRAAVGAARLVRRLDADLLHANSIRAGLIAVGAGRLTRRPVIVHVRDRLPRSTLADASLRTIAAGAAAVVANSEYTAAGVRAVSEPRELIALPNPVNLGRFDPARLDRDAARGRLGLRRWELVLGVVGQITPWKGQLEAVEALRLLVEQRPELRLVIAGEPKFVTADTRYDNRAYLGELEAAIAAGGLSDRVRLLGERADVPELMSALDILLVPSWEEPFGRVVVEAMAVGLPVLATSVGGPAEIIRDGVDGLLLAPRDATVWASTIDRVCADETLRRRLGRAGRARVARFGVDAHVSAVVELYRRTLDRGPVEV